LTSPVLLVLNDFLHQSRIRLARNGGIGALLQSADFTLNTAAMDVSARFVRHFNL